MQQTAGIQGRKKNFFHLRGKGENIENGGKETCKREKLKRKSRKKGGKNGHIRK